MIGLDLGTSNCKAVLLDAKGHVTSKATEGYELQIPHPGWAEQDVRRVWGAAKSVLSALAESASVPLQGICISGAMHSLLPIADDAGTPLSNAMTWADARATVVHNCLVADADIHALYRRTGCPVHAPYHVQRLRWWHRRKPELAQRAHLWVAIKDWVLHALAGVWATDLSLASTTGLLSLRDLTWDPEAMQLAGVRPAGLPSLVSPSAVVGRLTAEAAAETGLTVGLPVIAGASDGALATLGTGVTQSGQTVISVGTSGAVRKIVDKPWFDPSERTWCYLLTDEPETPGWFIGGAINNGGLALEWVRDKFYPDLVGAAGFEQLALDAASVPPGAEGVFLLPYFAGERSPHWAPQDRGVFYGLGMGHTRVHVARAAMEGVVNCLADVWDALYGLETMHDVVHLTGGITATRLWVQILADMLGVPLMVLDVADASAIGAGLLGMYALGLIQADEIPGRVEPGPVYAPDSERHAFYRQHHREYKALRRGMATLNETLENLKES
jgi:gluconokinase